MVFMKFTNRARNFRILTLRTRSCNDEGTQHGWNELQSIFDNELDNERRNKKADRGLKMEINGGL